MKIDIRAKLECMSDDTLYNLLKLIPMVLLALLAFVLIRRGGRNKPHGDDGHSGGGGSASGYEGSGMGGD